jgi:Domain of unknown function (DUF4430)
MSARAPGAGPTLLSPNRRAPGCPLVAVLVLAGVLCASVLCAGCGLGAGPAPSAVHLTVTRAFGVHLLRSWNAPQVRGEETVMSLLMRNVSVSTRYAGGFVQSIDGLSGGQEGGQPVDWFYYVNGVEAPRGAAATNVHPGDHIWWDRHDWSQADTVPAVVGSFPEPFLNGVEGKRLPVRIECAVLASDPCLTVAKRMRTLGVPAALAAIGAGGEPESLHILVGPWTAVRAGSGAQAIERGPRASGVYARFSANGSTLTVLNQRGSATRALTAGAGLIAATRYAEAAPVWVVTGTDQAGVELAAHAFGQATLENRFAVALAPGGAVVALPVEG